MTRRRRRRSKINGICIQVGLKQQKKPLLNGQPADLLPEYKPPIITGIASDGKRILVDDTGKETISDIRPEVIGLSAQAFTSLVRIFSK